jgi:hypothetical protein
MRESERESNQVLCVAVIVENDNALVQGEKSVVINYSNLNVFLF